MRRVLMNSVKPTPDLFFGDTPELNTGKAAEIVKYREKWKNLSF